MKKRQHRETSKEAHESIKEHKERMYEKIEEGMVKLRVGGTFEEISKVCGLKPEQVWKRLPEMVGLGTVYNVGITRPTSTGRRAMVRQLTQLLPKTTTQELQPFLSVYERQNEKPITNQTNLF